MHNTAYHTVGATFGRPPITHNVTLSIVGNGLDRSENGASWTPPPTANNVMYCSIGADIIRPPITHNVTYSHLKRKPMKCLL